MSVPPSSSVIDGIFTLIKQYASLVRQLPEDDYDFLCAFNDFYDLVTLNSATMIDLLKVCYSQIHRDGLGFDSKDSGPEWRDQLSTRFLSSRAIEAVETLLEYLDNILDSTRGYRMKETEQLDVRFDTNVLITSSAKKSNPIDETIPSGTSGSSGFRMRPQVSFEHPVDNSNQPFFPILYDNEGQRYLGTPDTSPFHDVIKNFVFPQWVIEHRTEKHFLSLELCPLIYVDTVSALEEIVDYLSNEKELAVDLEHHDFHSFLGFSCLMQISTRTKDIIIDCIKLRSKMHFLLPIFLDTNILKVFHGASEDVLWLQKDFGLYVANMFDTAIALQALHMPFSLAFAVDHFCQVKLQKKYQTADWRVRPLPQEMIHYARQDTHYLLYCYDRLNTMLLNKAGGASIGNLLLYVLEQSRQLCMTQYKKPIFNPETSFKQALGRYLDDMDPTQLKIAKDLFNWRDELARAMDESPYAIMSQASLLNIAFRKPLDLRELLRSCGTAHVAIRKHDEKLLEIVKKAITLHEPSFNSAELQENSHNDSNPCLHDGAGNQANSEAIPLGITKELENAPVKGDAIFKIHDLQSWKVSSYDFYQSLTGILPSIAQFESLPYTGHEATKVYKLNSPPSFWLTNFFDTSVNCGMKKAGNKEGNKTIMQIPLPGSETLNSLIKTWDSGMSDKNASHTEFGQLDNFPPPTSGNPSISTTSGITDSENTLPRESGDKRISPDNDDVVDSSDKTSSIGEIKGLKELYGLGKTNRKRSKISRKETLL